ncbi:c-type cytochrome [Dyadobacter bucti]|uniref:c-type cytochrome n=1 Tax=Dyadobacter bucti TaxID=2572203 RepID=UPI001E573FE1|nr:cytochrome c [Dyadobacter bucti]
MIRPAGALLVLGLLNDACQSSQELKSEQYFAEGYQLYTTYCSNCHQTDGKGMSGLYPPLVGSGQLTEKSRLACIIKNGMSDTIMVNGKEFSRPMPPNPKLKDLEIAEIVTYLNIKWGKDSVFTSIEFVEKSLKDCAPN